MLVFVVVYICCGLCSFMTLSKNKYFCLSMQIITTDNNENKVKHPMHSNKGNFGMKCA